VLFATHPKPYTPYTLGSFRKRELTSDRGGVEATHAFVLIYHRISKLPSITLSDQRRRKSSKCCANLVPQSRAKKSTRVRRRRRGGYLRMREEE